MNRMIFSMAVVAGALLVSADMLPAQPAPEAAPPAHERSRAEWATEAERELGLGRGRGRQLMTEEEWQDHRQKMQTLTGEDRQQYQHEWHTGMVERAKERGVTMPAEPPAGLGAGMGRGPGASHGAPDGMGGAGGMGAGSPGGGMGRGPGGPQGPAGMGPGGPGGGGGGGGGGR